jgi:hypothetical protein
MHNTVSGRISQGNPGKKNPNAALPPEIMKNKATIKGCLALLSDR